MRTPLKEIVSADKTVKASIELRNDGLFQLYISRWAIENVPGVGVVSEFWEPIEESLTDTLEHAETIAQEKTGYADATLAG